VPRDQVEWIERCVGWIKKRPRDANELLSLLRSSPPSPPSVKTSHSRERRGGDAKVLAMYRGHVIELEVAVFGSNKFFHDGREVHCPGFWTFGATHRFNVAEDGENVYYEVKLNHPFWGSKYVVKRNGEVIQKGQWPPDWPP
jgi:hypothetical protein